tara:strand:- start:280 stop:1032 length:753 start_codon:yes stop_codon:yes gene_type:complete
MTFHHGIGFATEGGFVLASHVRSDHHRDQYIAFVLGLVSDVTVIDASGNRLACAAALVPPGIQYAVHTGDDGLTAFVHLDPFRDNGMLRVRDGSGISPVARRRCAPVARKIDEWVLAGKDPVQRRECADAVLQHLATELIGSDLDLVVLDRRIMRCIDFVKRTDIADVSLTSAAKASSLSPSRLSHLFRRETGRTFRDFVLHQKLVRSLRAIHHGSGFTDASFSSGFADQPHFSNAFRKAFGVSPSSVKR